MVTEEDYYLRIWLSYILFVRNMHSYKSVPCSNFDHCKIWNWKISIGQFFKEWRVNVRCFNDGRLFVQNMSLWLVFITIIAWFWCKKIVMFEKHAAFYDFEVSSCATWFERNMPWNKIHNNEWNKRLNLAHQTDCFLNEYLSQAFVEIQICDRVGQKVDHHNRWKNHVDYAPSKKKLPIRKMETEIIE